MLKEIQRYIFWVDKNVENDENQKYLELMKSEFPTYEIKTFISISSCESYLKKEKYNYDFKFI